MRHLSVLAVALLIAACQAAGAEPPAPITVIVVRHAEKQDTGGDAAGLTHDGHRRAGELARVVRDAGVSAIYIAGDIKRTQDTAKPAADALKKPRQVVSTNEEFFSVLRNDHRGQTVLVVGRSTTIPDLLKDAVKVPADVVKNATEHIGERYDDFFVCTIADGTTTLVHLRYGTPSP